MSVHVQLNYLGLLCFCHSRIYQHNKTGWRHDIQLETPNEMLGVVGKNQSSSLEKPSPFVRGSKHLSEHLQLTELSSQLTESALLVQLKHKHKDEWSKTQRFILRNS